MGAVLRTADVAVSVTIYIARIEGRYLAWGPTKTQASKAAEGMAGKNARRITVLAWDVPRVPRSFSPYFSFRDCQETETL